MPVIRVEGIPDDTRGLELTMQKIKEHTAAVLKITLDQITVFFPRDLVQDGLGEELIVWVNGLFDKPERTIEVLQKLADNLAELIAAFTNINLEQCQLVEIFVQCCGSTKFAFVRRNLKKE